MPWTEGGAAGLSDRELEEAGSGTVPADPGSSIVITLDPVKVGQMLHGTWEDQGFILEVEIETDDLVRYHSRESAQSEMQPVLRIAYRLANNQFIYDGDGNRVKTIVDGVTTAYPGDHYEYEVGIGIARQYYNAGGRVAMRVSGDPEPSNNGVFYTLSEHLGSTSITVDESGVVIAELRYKAWGETRFEIGDTPTTWLYTGQRLEEGLGLYYYRGRWYDPVLGRFIQPDTIIPNPRNPLAYDRYAYVLNNPLRYSDPSGHMPCRDPMGICRGGENPPPPGPDTLILGSPVELELVEGTEWFGPIGESLKCHNDPDCLWNYDGYSQGIHAGIDLYVPAGTVVTSKIPGIGQIVDVRKTTAGYSIKVQYGAIMVVYQHVDIEGAAADLIWEFVYYGSVIGTVTDQGANSHLHLEVRDISGTLSDKPGVTSSGRPTMYNGINWGAGPQLMYNPLFFFPDSVVDYLIYYWLWDDEFVGDIDDPLQYTDPVLHSGCVIWDDEDCTIGEGY
jgi:RHS repeat-associated protein